MGGETYPAGSLPRHNVAQIHEALPRGGHKCTASHTRLLLPGASGTSGEEQHMLRHEAVVEGPEWAFFISPGERHKGREWLLTQEDMEELVMRH